jgi:hypothetical protein
MNEKTGRGTRAATELIRFALSQKHGAKTAWRDAQKVIEGGVTGDKAREVIGIARSIIETWFSLAQKARELCRDLEATTGPVSEMLAELEKAEEEASQVRNAVETMHGFLNRTKPPIDAVRLEKGKQSVAEGRYKTADEIRSSRKGQFIADGTHLASGIVEVIYVDHETFSLDL